MLSFKAVWTRRELAGFIIYTLSIRLKRHA